MNNGWIKLHRSLLDWEWWSDMNVRNLWLTILLLANHDEKKWQGQTVASGQLVTSLQHLAVRSGLSIQQTRTALGKLKSTGEINIQSTNKNTLITVIKWADFQCCEENSTSNQQSNNNQITNEQQTDNKQITTNKNVKNIKNEKNKRNIFVAPSLSEVKQYCEERHNRVDAERFINFYESKGWMVGKSKMKDWKAAVRTWEGNNYSKQPQVTESVPDYIQKQIEEMDRKYNF